MLNITSEVNFITRTATSPEEQLKSSEFQNYYQRRAMALVLNIAFSEEWHRIRAFFFLSYFCAPWNKTSRVSRSGQVEKADCFFRVNEMARGHKTYFLQLFSLLPYPLHPFLSNKHIMAMFEFSAGRVDDLTSHLVLW
ncbi:hypothetical protein CDAR_223801 [Caerostris darwini]|uniref:Maturase K n=1 Tax=Caerostris darwini TaxID=1538125 RepID=A0AAV4S366_9ARAC|nr:hypothetical protein CDAR_223801 [Caerostris darwini]